MLYHAAARPLPVDIDITNSLHSTLLWHFTFQVFWWTHQALSVLCDGQHGKSDTSSLDELSAFITNCRKCSKKWSKDHFPKDAANVFVYWKSFFTELCAVYSCFTWLLYKIALRITCLNKMGMGGESLKFQEQERLIPKIFFLCHQCPDDMKWIYTLCTLALTLKWIRQS